MFKAISRSFVILAIIGITITGCVQKTTVEEYRNLNEAMAKGSAGDRGWIPKFVPTSSTDIKIAYRVETNETWLIFKSDLKDLKQLLSECPAPSQYPELPRESPASWWPKFLTSASSEKKADWIPFVCAPEGAGVIDMATNQAYYWNFGS